MKNDEITAIMQMSRRWTRTDRVLDRGSSALLAFAAGGAVSFLGWAVMVLCHAQMGGVL